MQEKNNYYQGLYKAAKVEIGERVFRSAEIEKILEYVGNKKGDTLEIGSNLGRLSGLISKKTDSRVVGIDTNSSSFVYKIAKFRNRGRKTEFLQASGTQAPFADHSFERVVMSHVLEHFDYPDTILEEVKRVLMESGEVVITVPKEEYLGQLSKDHKLLFRSADDLVRLLQTQGFEIVDFTDLKTSIVVKAKIASIKKTD